MAIRTIGWFSIFTTFICIFLLIGWVVKFTSTAFLVCSAPKPERFLRIFWFNTHASLIANFRKNTSNNLNCMFQWVCYKVWQSKPRVANWFLLQREEQMQHLLTSHFPNCHVPHEKTPIANDCMQKFKRKIVLNHKHPRGYSTFNDCRVAEFLYKPDALMGIVCHLLLAFLMFYL